MLIRKQTQKSLGWRDNWDIVVKKKKKCNSKLRHSRSSCGFTSYGASPSQPFLGMTARLDLFVKIKYELSLTQDPTTGNQPYTTLGYTLQSTSKLCCKNKTPGCVKEKSFTSLRKSSRLRSLFFLDRGWSRTFLALLAAREEDVSTWVTQMLMHFTTFTFFS